MANRSYLYSTNVIPGPDVKPEERKLIGISEFNYDIPIVFKLLLSGNPRACRSSIWEMPEEIAIVGDYGLGLERLTKFLKRIEIIEAQPLIREAVEFLNRAENQNPYFVLECGEIFDMTGQPLLEQNQALLGQLNDLEAEMEKAMGSLKTVPVAPPKPVGFFSRMFKAKPLLPVRTPDPMDPFYELGLGNWSNILYFDFSNS